MACAALSFQATDAVRRVSVRRRPHITRPPSRQAHRSAAGNMRYRIGAVIAWVLGLDGRRYGRGYRAVSGGDSEACAVFGSWAMAGLVCSATVSCGRRRAMSTTAMARIPPVSIDGTPVRCHSHASDPAITPAPAIATTPTAASVRSDIDELTIRGGTVQTCSCPSTCEHFRPSDIEWPR